MSEMEEDGDEFPSGASFEESFDSADEFEEEGHGWSRRSSGEDRDEQQDTHSEEKDGSENEQKRHDDELQAQREVNKKYMNRLKRRTELVAELRKAYLRDVVCLKQLINEHLSKDERVEVAQAWKKGIPSIDMRQHLMLYGPKEASLDTIPCETCGGSVELVHHDSSEIEELSKALSHMDKNKDELRLIIATNKARLEQMEEKMEKQDIKHREEKKIMVNEMKRFKEKTDDIHKENIQSNAQIRSLKEKLSELRDKANMYDKVEEKLRNTEASLIGARKNMKNLEESNAKYKDNIKKITDQLSLCAEEKSSLEEDIEKQNDHIKSITNVSAKHKKNSENLSKKLVKLEKLLDNSQTEVKSLTAKVQDLEISLDQQNQEMSGEIESLESMLDTAREEASTLNEQLHISQSQLSEKVAENDILQKKFNEYRSAKEPIIAKLEQEVSAMKQELRNSEADLSKKSAKLEKVESDFDKLRETAAEYEKDSKELKKLSKDYEKTKREFDKLNAADKERRKQVREEKKKYEQAEAKRLEALASGTEKMTVKREPSRKKIKDKTRREQAKAMEKKVVEEGFQPPSRVPHKRQPGKCRSSPVKPGSGFASPSSSMSVVSSPRKQEQQQEKGEDKEGSNSNSSDERAASARASKGDRLRENDCEVENERELQVTVDTADVSSHQQTDEDEGDARCDSEEDDHDECEEDEFDEDQFEEEAVPPAPTGKHKDESSPHSARSTVLARGDDNSKAQTVKAQPKIKSKDFASAGMDFSVEAEMSGALSFLRSAEQTVEGLPQRDDKRTESQEYEGSQSSSGVYGFETGIPMPNRLLNACKKLIIDENLAEEVGISKDFADTVISKIGNVKEILQAESSSDTHDHHAADEPPNVALFPSSDDDQSLCSDIHCEHRDYSSELNDETAKIFGSLLKDIHVTLQNVMTVKESTDAIAVLAPNLVELSSVMAKSQISLWKSMRMTKQQTDRMCKFASMCNSMAPFWGNAQGLSGDDVLELQSKLKNHEFFDQFCEKWMDALQVDKNMMKKLTEKEWNERASMFVDLPSSRHFDYDDEREYSFDVAFNAMILLETFTKNMSSSVESLLSKCFLDWSSNKMRLFDEGKALNSIGEAELGRVYEELTALKLEMEFLEIASDKVSKEKKELEEKVALLEPDAIRCGELVARSTKLANDLQTSNTNLVNLTEKHNALVKANKSLQSDHAKAEDLIKKQAQEIDSLKKSLSSTQQDLESETKVKASIQEELDAALRKERIRLFELIDSDMQTEPFVEHVACQTDFIVPPMSLHHKMSSSLSRQAPASKKRSFYPVVTPGTAPARGFVASLHDEFDHSDRRLSSEFSGHFSGSANFDIDTNASSICDGSDLLEERSVLTPILMHHESDLFSNSRPGSKANSRGFSESLKMLNKITTSQNKSKLDVGLPSITLTDASSDAGSQTSSSPIPLSGKLSPVKYVRPTVEGPLWKSDTIRLHPRKHRSRSESINELNYILEAHRQKQAPSYRRDMKSR